MRGSPERDMLLLGAGGRGEVLRRPEFVTRRVRFLTFLAREVRILAKSGLLEKRVSFFKNISVRVPQ